MVDTSASAVPQNDPEPFHLNPKLSLTENVLMRATSLAGAGLLLIGAPLFMKPRWDAFVNLLGGEKNTVASALVGCSLATVTAANLFMLPIYRANLPFFERFRVSKKDFVWRSEDPKVKSGFFSLLKKYVEQERPIVDVYC